VSAGRQQRHLAHANQHGATHNVPHGFHFFKEIEHVQKGVRERLSCWQKISFWKSYINWPVVVGVLVYHEADDPARLCLYFQMKWQIEPSGRFTMVFGVKNLDVMPRAGCLIS
jgi:hypothetical protein